MKQSMEASTMPLLEEERMYRDICMELGDICTESGDNDHVNEDDKDIEVMRNGTDMCTLKCPFTGGLLEKPMRNKPCNHSYSEVEILQYMQECQRNHKHCHCPVAGCSSTVSFILLEKDISTEIMVLRQKRRQQHSDEIWTKLHTCS